MKLALVLLASLALAAPIPDAEADAAPAPMPGPDAQPEADLVARIVCSPAHLTPESCRQYCGGGRISLLGNKCCCPGRW
jgi:hypothetical protein